MAKVSFIMTARNEPHLPRMVDEIFAKARGEFEVILVQDGAPYQPLKERPGLTNITGDQRGLKPNINLAAGLATGKYLLKFDAHCSMSEGIDVVLQKNMFPECLVVPRFYVLDAKTWNWQDERFYDYFKLCCPLTDKRGYRFQAAGHWPERTAERLLGPRVDETMQMHGSCWMVDRDFFLNQIEGMSSIGYDTFGMEPPELCLKYWLGRWDGQVMVNKNAWYAHMHKGGQNPRGYELSNARIKASYDFAANFWMRNAWVGRAHDIEWLVDRFWPIPGWPENWRELQEEYERTHDWVAPDGSEAEAKFYSLGERAMTAMPASSVSQPKIEHPEQSDTLHRLRELIPNLDIAHHSPNRPTEFRMSRHPRKGTIGLADVFRELEFFDGVEVGTEEGRYASELLTANPRLQLTCVDPWLAYDRYKDTVEQERNDRYYEAAKARLEPFLQQERVTLYRAPSMEAVHAFVDNSLDFVFIDGNHDFRYVVNDILEWSDKVRPGGIVSGHDYKQEAKNHRIPFHVVPALNGYIDAYHIKPWFVIRGDKAASWFFVKP